MLSNSEKQTALGQAVKDTHALYETIYAARTDVAEAKPDRLGAQREQYKLAFALLAASALHQSQLMDSRMRALDLEPEERREVERARLACLAALSLFDGEVGGGLWITAMLIGGQYIGEVISAATEQVDCSRELKTLRTAWEALVGDTPTAGRKEPHAHMPERTAESGGIDLEVEEEWHRQSRAAIALLREKKAKGDPEARWLLGIFADLHDRLFQATRENYAMLYGLTFPDPCN